MKKTQLLTILFIAGYLNSLFVQSNSTVYQWRGTDRKGIYSDSKIADKWPENGPKLLWEIDNLGFGYSAPVILEDKLLINGETDTTSYVFAFDLNGKFLWKTPNGKEHYGSGYAANFPGARSTPTVLGNLVYSISGTGRLMCCQVSDGKEIWAVQLVKDLGGMENYFGYSESPAVDEKYVYCFPGGKTGNMAALDRFTGKTQWLTKALGDTTSFCSPIIANVAGKKVLVNLSHHYIFGIDISNGELLWSKSLPGFKYDGEHCNTPIYEDGFLYYTAAEDLGKGLVKLALEPDGRTIKEIWNNQKATAGFGGMVKVNNYIFTTNKKKKFLSIDTNIGQVTDTLSNCKGGLIYAYNKLICYNETGEVKLIDFQNNKFKEISKLKITKGTKEHFAHPVVNKGILYIRHGSFLMAFDIK